MYSMGIESREQEETTLQNLNKKASVATPLFFLTSYKTQKSAPN